MVPLQVLHQKYLGKISTAGYPVLKTMNGHQEPQLWDLPSAFVLDPEPWWYITLMGDTLKSYFQKPIRACTRKMLHGLGWAQS